MFSIHTRHHVCICVYIYAYSMHFMTYLSVSSPISRSRLPSRRGVSSGDRCQAGLPFRRFEFVYDFPLPERLAFSPSYDLPPDSFLLLSSAHIRLLYVLLGLLATVVSRCRGSITLKVGSVVGTASTRLDCRRRVENIVVKY